MFWLLYKANLYYVKNNLKDYSSDMFRLLYKAFFRLQPEEGFIKKPKHVVNIIFYLYFI
jgi:hypothetical protein